MSRVADIGLQDRMIYLPSVSRMIVRSARGSRMRNGQCSSTTMGVSTMSDYDRNVTTAPFGQAIGRAGSVAVDEGLRAYMLRIYNYMVLGLAITGAAALGTYMLSVTTDPSIAAMKMRDGLMLTAFGKALFVSWLKWVVIFAPLGLVFLLSFGIERMRPATAQLMFWIYAALVGVSLASIFMVFTHTSVVRVFFITAASFGALSLYGYTTQRDLTGMGSFLMMGLFGVILASVVNLFMASSALQFAISVGGVLVFAGLTAWDTQRLKTEYLYGAMDGETTERSAIIGALSLYLNFINLFTLLLQLLGQRDE
jgi:FtsH-binding integral membrane protein